MSDHGTHHHHEADHHAEPKSKTSFRASFWFVIILVGLFIGAVNFVSVMGHEEGGHEATEQHHEGGAPAMHETAVPETTEHADSRGSEGQGIQADDRRAGAQGGDSTGHHQ